MFTDNDAAVDDGRGMTIVFRTFMFQQTNRM